MNQNQFQFRRFWRLLRVTFAETVRIFLYIALLFIVVMLVFRVGHVIFSLDDIPAAFESGVKSSFSIASFFAIMYFLLSVGMITGFFWKFLCPVTNLERFIMIHTLSLFYMMMFSIIVFFSVEILWRLGLWLMFPGEYAQYVEIAARYPYWENFWDRASLYIILLLIMSYYGAFAIKYADKKHMIIYYWLIPFAYVALMIGAFFFLKSMKWSYGPYLLLGIFILPGFFLIRPYYRSFCRYELVFEKSTNE